MSPPVLAQTISPVNYPPGLCFQGQLDISGSWVNDGTGELVPLTTLCEIAIQHQRSVQHQAMQKVQAMEAQVMQDAQAGQDAMSLLPVETGFWQAFVTAASPEALAFANEAEMDNVVAYGETICPSLDELGTLHELRVIQAEGGLPASFDAAVNVAAIHTYCPDKARSIGK